MKSRRVIHLLSFVLAFFCLTDIAFGETQINSETVVIEGSLLAITGSGFGAQGKKSSIELSLEGEVKTATEIVEWTDDKILVQVPFFPTVLHHTLQETQETIAVIITTEKEILPEKILSFQNRNDFPISELIQLKEEGFSDEFILNQFDKIVSKEKKIIRSLNKIELVNLKKAGFNDDIVASLGNHSQSLTVGLAAIWLEGTADLVPSPMLRIIISPRGYFEPREGVLDRLSNADLTLGYTKRTSTTKENNSETKNYLLVGLAIEINRSALFNFGYALVPGDAQGKETQAYFGITIDSNILKDLGILQKG